MTSTFLQILGLQPRLLQSFSRSLEQFFLTVGQNDFGNKIPFLTTVPSCDHIKIKSLYSRDPCNIFLAIWKKREKEMKNDTKKMKNWETHQIVKVDNV